MEKEGLENKAVLEADAPQTTDAGTPATEAAEKTPAVETAPSATTSPKTEDTSDVSVKNAAAAAAPDSGAKKDGKTIGKDGSITYDDPHLQQLHDNRMHKKGARAVFHLINFGGLHQAFNNIASVVITYVMATTNTADKMKDKMGTTAVGKGLSKVLSLPGKAVNGIFKVCGVDLNKELNAMPEAAKKAELEFRTLKSQRSAIETAFMCIAGFIALLPVYYLENHRQGFLNKVDNWLHPGRSPKEKEAASLKKGDEPKETLWNLFRARIIALAVVFGVDQTRDNIDSILKHKHEAAGKAGMYKNVDTVFGWGLGNKIYDKLPEKARGWLARFFSGNLKGEKVVLSGIQHEVRMDALKVTGASPEVMTLAQEMTDIGKKMRLKEIDKALGETRIKAIDQEIKALTGGHAAVERAVFAEQSRLFLTKEVFLTTILSIVIYTCTKAPFAAHFMEKIGLAKKGTYDKEHHLGKYAHKPEQHKGPAKEEKAAQPEARKEEKLEVTAAAPATDAAAPKEAPKDTAPAPQTSEPAAEPTLVKEEAAQKVAAKLSEKLAPTTSYAEAAKARKDSPGTEAAVNI